MPPPRPAARVRRSASGRLRGQTLDGSTVRHCRPMDDPHGVLLDDDLDVISNQTRRHAVADRVDIHEGIESHASTKALATRQHALRGELSLYTAVWRCPASRLCASVSIVSLPLDRACSRGAVAVENGQSRPVSAWLEEQSVWQAIPRPRRFQARSLRSGDQYLGTTVNAATFARSRNHSETCATIAAPRQFAVTT